MDIPLNSFQDMVGNIKPFKKSYSFLIAHDGSFVAHPKLENITGSIAEIDPVYNEKYDLLNKIQNGESISFIEKDPEESGENYITISPVFIGETTTPWSIGISVPIRVIMASAIKNFSIAIVIATMGLALLTIIIWLISRNITRPLIKTTGLLKDLARGAIDKSSILEIETSDEIGEMTASANTLVEFLQSTADCAKQIGEGNLSADYHLLSEEDILGNSLIEMRNKLKESKEQIEAQAGKLMISNRELEKLSVVARETDNGVIIMDAEGNVEWINEGLVRLYGFSFEEFKIERGNNILNISSNPAITQILKECIRDKCSVHYISENITKSGDIVWAQTTMTPIVDDNNEVVKLVTIDSDITKIKEAETEISRHLVDLEKHRDELQELNATKDRFFALIAHDLKNPFTALLSITQTLSTSFSALEEDEKQFYIDRVYQTATHLVNLLNNLLLWASAQTGKMAIHPEKLDIKQMTLESIDLLRASADKKNISIKEKIEDNTFAFADKNMIDTVLRNLISNALKYTKSNGSIIVSTMNKTDHMIEIFVKDNGIGITPKHLSRLFQIDRNPSTPGTSDEKGTGLGLILCKDFVEKNKGTIQVESQEGKGSVFRFSLPLYID